MRSILHHHFETSTAPSCLILGCRGRSLDFLYEQEWIKATNTHPFRLITAFSRDQQQKIYVQHRILENGPYLWSLIEQGATIYLSG
jgi:NADPH-ferrihemoprotein reductase